LVQQLLCCQPAEGRGRKFTTRKSKTISHHRQLQPWPWKREDRASDEWWTNACGYSVKEEGGLSEEGGEEE
jgi:hypothetical protein